ncbi:MAG: Band 7 protein [Candidatus Roizmanbacteria bacterium GW2011_GWB1_40_7]|uniref:Band 7 protein n=2 Tax=Candidatus Roizmaniibacteriota TaxID=1752723 RepID=A0A0G0T4V4_9BACT|nr:MAG: Band 7 protein [Candidatus Levybacteria bacterium GW2011_GWA2_40_16]KKR72044.1 MAG: Band 7 protein [Candidatus Roizmanbacteria bacterium GW2011_GWB1_40_7]KKR94391.1 MAG: Band 7 protein [Candidatus Roizmanbacteria bacterium GW2011_GWA1_41_13]
MRNKIATSLKLLAMTNNMESFFFTTIAIIGIVALFRSLRIVNQYEKGIILRLGRYLATADPGITFLMPFLDGMTKVDMRERVINVIPQEVITKDNVSVVVDAVIYYKVTDPVKAEFEIEDFDLAATTLAQANLRNIIGEKTLDETLTARDVINVNLRDVLDEATDNWGVKVTRVEVQKIDPPQDIVDAMSKQMKAEREKRATILTAEAIKQSNILEAEGRRQRNILDAEGDAKARILRADAEALAVQRVAEAAEKYFKERAQLLKKLDVSQEVLSKGTKWILPDSADLVNVLNLSEEKILPIKK